MLFWQSISQIIGSVDLRIAPDTPDLRLAAKTLATEVFGPTVLELPALINVAALAISMRARLTNIVSVPGPSPKYFIEKTHGFGSRVIDVSSGFITKEPGAGQ